MTDEARPILDTVVLLRHPAAFASSLKRLGWSFDVNSLVDQPSLMEHHLAPFRAELEAATRQSPDLIDQAVLLWRVVTHTSLAYRARYPEWIVARYEELADRIYGPDSWRQPTKISRDSLTSRGGLEPC